MAAFINTAVIISIPSYSLDFQLNIVPAFITYEGESSALKLFVRCGFQGGNYENREREKLVAARDSSVGGGERIYHRF
jgi:hypothetical protein